MKTHVRALLACLFALTLFLSACAAQQPAENPSSLRPALPTASVPPLESVDAAIQRWKDSGNQRYYLKVDEKTSRGLRRLHIVVDDGQVRAALVQERSGDTWGELSSLPFAQAEKYTVDGLLARVRRDTLGAGPAPVNLKVVFDKDTGVPLVVNAEGMPSYTPDGQVQLNREFGYTLTAEIAALLEDTSGNQSGVWLELAQGNGPQNRCDHLYIFQDGASFYTDDCRQTSLPLQLPAARMDELQALAAQFSTLEDAQRENNAYRRLFIQGGGASPADEAQVQAAWKLTDQLYDLLSYPLGAGVTLIFTQDEQVFGAEMLRQTMQPARIAVRPPLYGAAVSADEQYLALSDSAGLQALNPDTGAKNTLLIAPQDDSYYRPLEWNAAGQLLLEQVFPDGGLRLGWVSIAESRWHDLPLPPGADSFACYSGAAWSPDGLQVAVAASGEGQDCGGFSGLALVDVQKDAAALVPGIAAAAHPAWSADGSWLAFSMPESDARRVYVVHPDGGGLAPVSANSRGRADWPVWTPDGTLLYAVQDAPAEENGLYRYDLGGGEASLLIPGAALQPVSVSPDGEFLLYRAAEVQQVWSFLREENMDVTLKQEAGFAGWLTPPQQ